VHFITFQVRSISLRARALDGYCSSRQCWAWWDLSTGVRLTIVQITSLDLQARFDLFNFDNQSLSSILYFILKRSALLCGKWSPNKLSLTPNIKLFVYGCVCIPLYISRLLLLLLQLLYPLFQRCLHFMFSLIVHYDYYIDVSLDVQSLLLASFKLGCSPVGDVTNAKKPQFSSNLI